MINKYISWKPDADFVAIDTFPTTLEKYFNNCFPPFSLIWQVLSKIKKELANTILIEPLWPTQNWFPAVPKLIVAKSIIVNSSHLQLPGTKQKLPLHPPLKLSGFSLIEGYIKARILSQSAETVILASWKKTTKSRYATVLKRWKNFCCRRKIDPFQSHVNYIIEFLIEIYNSAIGYTSV